MAGGYGDKWYVWRQSTHEDGEWHLFEIQPNKLPRLKSVCNQLERQDTLEHAYHLVQKADARRAAFSDLGDLACGACVKHLYWNPTKRRQILKHDFQVNFEWGN